MATTDTPTQLATITTQTGLSVESANTVIAAFAPLYLAAQELVSAGRGFEVKGEDDAEGIAKAREMRLKLRKVRCEAENERLRKEKEEADKWAREEMARRDREAKEAEAAARAEREKLEAATRAEREAREKAERELQEQKDAEDRRRREEERAAELRAQQEAEARAKAARAPDKEKLLAFAAQVGAMPRPEMVTQEGIAAMGDIAAKISLLVSVIERNARAL
jgi:hypothetical protein